MTVKSGEVFFSEQSNRFFIPESISIFGFSVSFFGLFLVLAAVIGIGVAVKEARKRQQNVEWILTLLTLTIVCSILGARVYYALFQWQKFVQEPLALFNLRSGGLSYFGALLGAWIAVKWYCQRKKAGFEQSADTLCIGAAASAVFVWLGCIFVREPVGRFSDGFFSVRIGLEYLPDELEMVYADELTMNTRRLQDSAYISVHPVAVYGVIASLLVFLFLMFIKRFLKTDGALFWLYLFSNSMVSALLEYFRADHSYVWGTEIPVTYIVAGVLGVLSIGWLIKPRLSTHSPGRRR